MKKYLLLLLIFVSIVSVSMAQDRGAQSETGRLQAYKIAFLTKRLKLTPEEAQRFWPVYNQYEKEIRDLRIENRQTGGDVIEADEKILNVRKKYNIEFSKVLPAEKVSEVFRAEKEFASMVQKELIERRQQRKN